MSDKAASYTLKQGHETTFRRTIVPASLKTSKVQPASYQLVLEPGQHYEFSDEEVAGLEKEISTGLLVPSDIDEHGRQRPIKADRRTPPKAAVNDVKAVVADETKETETPAQPLTIDDLEISEGTRNSLREAELVTVADIEMYREEHDGLVGIAGIGPAKAEEVETAIAAWK